jgi:hypothetical protein
LDAIHVGIEKHDADIRGFFDAIDHEWLIKFVERRIGDKRGIRHIRKWPNAGVFEDETWKQQEEGTRRAEALARCWRTSTCATCSTAGLANGGIDTQRAM